MSDKVGLLLEAEQLRRERDEAREVALGLLKIVESYVRLDVGAPKRIRDEAAAAREKIEEWGKLNDSR
jgi:hypothetical protein